MKNAFLYVVVGLSLVLLSCDEIRTATDVVTKPTGREVYYRSFDDTDSLLIQFKKTFGRAFQDSLLVSLPYAETGIFSSTRMHAYSYDVQLREGQELVVSVEKQPDSAVVLMELFKKTSDSITSYELLTSSQPNQSELTHIIESYGDYKIIVQPAMSLPASFQLKVYTKPTYAFPVSGAGNKNVQSFWADSRDGGKRSHEGIDIFADKGTPLIAITDGRISATPDRGRGGKQVWLRDGFFGKTIYYAHLDSIAVTKGQRVQVGDTVGFVGNTGNAKTTPPHLHFGIYKGATGAVDPYPYIKYTEIPEIKEENTVVMARVKRNKTDLYQGPSSGLASVRSLSKNDTVYVLGQYASWFHIATKDSLKGFMQRAKVNAILSDSI